MDAGRDSAGVQMGGGEMLRFIRAAACVALAMLASAASAQTYPGDPVKLIVPIPAGGGTHGMGRGVGQRVEEVWGQAGGGGKRAGGDSRGGGETWGGLPPPGRRCVA